MPYSEYLLQISTLLGYILFFFIIFAESGLFFGLFLPGDSLLFSLGLAAAAGHFNFPLLLAIGSTAAILGDSVGYAFGRYFGERLFNKPNSRFFKQEHLIKAHNFYQQHGKKTIILARFIPFVRTFAPIVAGAAKMDYSTFLTFNIIGGLGWVIGVTSLGYYLGRLIPNIEHYFLPIIGAIIVASIIPALTSARNSKTESRAGTVRSGK